MTKNGNPIFDPKIWTTNQNFWPRIKISIKKTINFLENKKNVVSKLVLKSTFLNQPQNENNSCYFWELFFPKVEFKPESDF